MDLFALEEASRGLLSSIMVGGDWGGSHLDRLMISMNAFGGGPSRAVPPHFFAVASCGVRDLLAELQAGRAPPLTKNAVLPVSAREGFIVDSGLPIHDRRRRDPFINEFLRPRGVFDTATAFLDDTEEGYARLLVFRDQRQGDFKQSELRDFDRALPYLRAAAMVSRGSLQTTSKRRAEPFDRRGEPVLYLGPDGRVIEVNAAAEDLSGRPVRLINRRLVAEWRLDQLRLDRALTTTLVEARPSLVTLSGAASTIMALLLPVGGDARDVFQAVAAVAVLIEPARRRGLDEAAIGLLNQAADLTAREIDVVRLVGTGRSPRQAADELGIAYGTIRNHLKAAFAKLGVHSQGELVALVQRLR